MENYNGQVKLLMNVGGDYTGGEILKSLLTSSKMQKTKPTNMNILTESRNQPEEPIVFQIELGEPVKSEFIPTNENIIQDIPVTYLMANNSNVNTSMTPVTYVLSRETYPEATTRQWNTIGGPSEPQKLIFVQEMDSDPSQTVYNVPDTKLYAVKESQTGMWNGIKTEGERREETKGQIEKKISPRKKPITKKKTSKLKTKLKTKSKALSKPKLNEGHDEEIEKKKLFELTKLEDNVDQVAERLKIGCDCSDSNCFDGLNPDDVFRHRLNIADLTKAEHDMYLMGVIMASICNLEETCRHKERIRIRSCYAYKGKKVCLTAFLYLQHVTLYQMKRLRNHLKNHGVSPRIHGNSGRKPPNTLSLDIYRCAFDFFQKYIEEHCIKPIHILTGLSSNKTKGFGKKTNAFHLPAECTRRVVHKEYRNYCESFKPSQKAMKYSTFTKFLKKQFPNVKFHKKEEKKVKTDEWKPKEETETFKEEPGVDKSIQVQLKKEVFVNGQPGELFNETGFGGSNLGVYNQNTQYYSIGSAV